MKINRIHVSAVFRFTVGEDTDSVTLDSKLPVNCFPFIMFSYYNGK